MAGNLWRDAFLSSWIPLLMNSLKPFDLRANILLRANGILADAIEVSRFTHPVTFRLRYISGHDTDKPRDNHAIKV